MTYTKIGTPFLRGLNKAVAGKQYLVLNDEDTDFPKGYVVKAESSEDFSCVETGGTDCYMLAGVRLQEIVVGTQPQTILSKHAEDGKKYIVKSSGDSDFPIGTEVTYRSRGDVFISAEYSKGLPMWDHITLQEITEDPVLAEITELKKQVAALKTAYEEKLLAEQKAAEPKYTVIIPNPNQAIGVKSVIALRGNNEGKVYMRSTSNVAVTVFTEYHLTEEQIKEDYEWAWQFAEKVA